MSAARSMSSGKVGTVTTDSGELKLGAYVISGPTLSASDVSLSLEKPGSFLIDLDVPQQDVRFQFMNTARILEKQLNMTYTRMMSENRTILDGAIVLDPNNKISANYVFVSRNLKLTYSYVHEGLSRLTTFEPCYALGKNSWELGVSRSVLDGDIIRASYEM